MEPQWPTLGQQPRLFVDWQDVDRRENVTRVFHQAVRYGSGPVLRQEMPWEQHPGMTASVIYDPEQRVFKAWYMAGCYSTAHRHVQCLALSADGVHWERPNLGVHEALGSTRNNIVIPASHHDGMDHFESVLKDPFDPDPNRRYKALGWSSYDWDGPLAGIYTAVSPDGIHWSHGSEPVFRFHPRPGTADLGPVGDAQSLMIDARRRRYAACLRGTPERLVSWSDDFSQWTPPQPCLAPAYEEEALYNHTAFTYGEHYLGILTHFEKGARAQTQVLRLLISRDGQRWLRSEGPPLLPLGEIGEWDRFQLLLTGAPPVQVGDRLHLYYRGTARRHNKVPREYDPSIAADQDPRSMAIGLATLRADGFASVGASFDGGTVTTVPMRVDGEQLLLNVKADYGEVRVACLDEQFTPIAGYSAEECLPVQVDAVAAPVRWGAGHGCAGLNQRPVRLAFHLRNARLYAYRCTSGAAAA